MYAVYFDNHDYFSQEQFNSFDDAVAYVKSKCMDATILMPYNPRKPHQGGETVGHWSYFGGLQDRRTV